MTQAAVAARKTTIARRTAEMSMVTPVQGKSD
jgi:hypothetical protein